MIRTFGAVNAHTHLISWLLVILEVILMAYQLFRFYTSGFDKRNLVSLTLLLFAIIWNCTPGYLEDLETLIIANIAALMAAGLAMLVPLFYGDPKEQQAKPPGTSEVLENSEEPTDSFMENCRKNNFTPRETEIAILIRKGYKNRQIADELHISEKTVESHLQHIYDKVGVRSKLALITKLNQ